MSFQKSIDALNKAVNSVFGTDATYTYLSDGFSQTIRGVFNDGFIQVAGNVIERRTTFENVVLANLRAEPTEGDRIVVNSVNYMVRVHEPDTHGSTTIFLEKI